MEGARADAQEGVIRAARGGRLIARNLRSTLGIKEDLVNKERGMALVKGRLIILGSSHATPWDTHKAKVGLVLFLDTYEFLTVSHQVFFERWILSHQLIPGDLVYVTTSLPPWEFLRGSFQAQVGAILKNYGASDEDVANKEYLKRHYIPILLTLTYFVETWRYRRLSQRGFQHFYSEVYRDTRIPMALNGFVVT